VNIKTKQIEWNQVSQLISSMPVFRDCSCYANMNALDWPSITDYQNIFSCFHDSKFITFIEQQKKSRRKKREIGAIDDTSLANYIEKIAMNRELPVRLNNVHDFFNSMTFVMFPKTKFKIMSLHFLEAQKGQPNLSGGGRGRTRAQDYLTLFDEGGAIKLGSADENFIIFGHGIYEQCIFDPKPVRALTWDLTGSPLAEVAGNRFNESHHLFMYRLDEMMSQLIEGSDFFAKSSDCKGEYIPEFLYRPAKELNRKR
jgi:hypothetical protein